VSENTPHHRNITISRLVLLNDTNDNLNNSLRALLSKVVYDFNLLLFRPFLFSSKLDHTTYPVLLLVTEPRRYQSISFSLLKDHSQHAIHTTIVSVYLQAIRRMLRLQDAIILRKTNEGLFMYPSTFAAHLVEPNGVPASIN